MDKQEFLLLIPAIIYGVAIVDLMKIFQNKKNYWETVLWGIYMFVIIVFAWTELYQKLNVITDDIKSFFLVIIQSVVYAQAIRVLTPEEKDDDTESYFLENRRTFFLLIAAIIIVNVAVQILVFDDQRPSWIRPVGLALVLTCAYYDSKRVRATVWGFFSVVSVLFIFF